MPWNENNNGPKGSGGPWGGGGSGGDDGNGGSPWKRPGGGGGNGSPDLEEQMRRMQERFRQRRGGRGGGGRGAGGKSLGPLGFGLIGAVAFFAWLATGVVIVDEGERAAIFRLGKYQNNFQPGFHVHLPAPIETHEIIPAQKQQTTVIGENNTSESLMLTGDENIVDVQFRVRWFYDRERPENFILNVDNGEPLVKAAAESVMREVVGKSTLDQVITSGRGEIQARVLDDLQALLNDYAAGVAVSEVQILDSQPPAAVSAAFIDVVNAGQDAEKATEEARRFANDIIPRARGDAEQLLQQAQAYRDQVIANATGEASRFEQILEEYQKAPRVTRERMYLETTERVLGRSEKLLLDNESGAVPYLPLDRVDNRRAGQ